jgi:hypothetical protein
LFAIAFTLCAITSAEFAGVSVISPNKELSAFVNSSVASDGSQDISIDVSDAFADQLGNDHMLQVNMTLQVSEGKVFLSGQPMGLGVTTTVRLNAMLYEKIRATGAIVGARSTSVVVQVIVVEILQGSSRPVIVVQELIREIEGTRITEVGVQEATMEVDVNGTEVTRSVTEIAFAESRLATVTTPAAIAAQTETPNPAGQSEAPNPPANANTEYPIGDSPTDDNTTSPSDSPDDSPDSPDDSPNEGHNHDHHGHHDCKLCKWYRRQSFGVRVLVSAAVSFVSVLVFYLMFRCLRRVCSRHPQTRSVYLSNVKMQYQPLATDPKKALVV